MLYASAHQASRSDGQLNVFPDYLIKWQGLPYSESTWEAGELISKEYHHSLEEYNIRNKAQTIPSKYCKVSGQMQNIYCSVWRCSICTVSYLYYFHVSGFEDSSQISKLQNAARIFGKQCFAAARLSVRWFELAYPVLVQVSFIWIL